MHQDANDLAVADHLVEVVLDGLLAEVVGPLLAGLGERLLLARVPAQVPCRLAKGKETEADLVGAMPIGDYCSSHVRRASPSDGAGMTRSQRSHPQWLRRAEGFD